jgi:hypothetical protein
LVERLTVEDLRSYQAVTGSNPVVRMFFCLLLQTVINFKTLTFLSKNFLYLMLHWPFLPKITFKQELSPDVLTTPLKEIP